MSLPVITFGQFKLASGDLMEQITSGSVQSQIPRAGVDISLVAGYVLQFVRDRNSPLPDPSGAGRGVFGLSLNEANEDTLEEVSNTFRRLALEVNGDKYASRMNSAPVQGAVIDWIVAQGLEALLDWVMSQQGLEIFQEILQFVLDQLRS